MWRRDTFHHHRPARRARYCCPEKPSLSAPCVVMQFIPVWDGLTLPVNAGIGNLSECRTADSVSFFPCAHLVGLVITGLDKINEIDHFLRFNDRQVFGFFENHFSECHRVSPLHRMARYLYIGNRNEAGQDLRPSSVKSRNRALSSLTPLPSLARR